jgi:hypothetical protein
VLLTAPGCSADEPGTAGRTGARPSVTSRAESSATPGTGRFDGLTISLTLRSTTVQQGKTLRSRATVKNNSPDAVVDPACVIATGRYALVPVD